jgi:hypothetical protein
MIYSQFTHIDTGYVEVWGSHMDLWADQCLVRQRKTGADGCSAPARATQKGLP